jgi:hypothetical protein
MSPIDQPCGPKGMNAAFKIAECPFGDFVSD